MGRITLNSIYLTAEKGAHLAFAMLLMVGVARVLGEGGLGNYAYVIALTSLFLPILDLGLNNRVIRNVAADDAGASSAATEAVSLKLGMAAPALVLMALAAWASGKSLEIFVAVLLVGASTVAMSLGDAINSVFKGLQRPIYSVLLVASMNGLLFAVGTGAMLSGLGLVGVAACYLLCRGSYLGVGLGLVHRVTPRHRPEFKPAIRRQLIGQGLRYLPPAYFLMNLLNLNFITTDLVVGEAQSGQYAIGYRLATALFVLASASLEAILPALSSEIRAGTDLRHTLSRSFGALFAITLVGVGIIQIAARPVTIWIFGPEYAPSVGPIRLLVWTVPPFVLCGLAHTALLALDRQAAGAVSMLALVVLGTGLGVVGILVWNADVAAMAPTGTGGLFAIILWGMVWRELRKR